MIEIKNLTKKYGSFTAVDNISFTANKHEVLGFLGPNGAGKSTTMNMIAGYLPSTSGTIIVDGIDISKDPMAVRKKIGYLPEIPPLYMDMKVREYLSFAAGLKGVPKAQREMQIARAMSRLRITDMQGRLIKNLSKGYKQRVGFAQALRGEPEVLILDEPTVGMDPNQILEVRDLINKLKANHTIIFSSHIMQEVSAVCDRAVIIKGGKIKAIDTMENLAGGKTGSVMVLLKASGDKFSISGLIKAIKGVKDIVDIEDISESSFAFKIETSSEDVKKEIISELSKNNISIDEISTMKLSMEEIFVNLTR